MVGAVAVFALNWLAMPFVLRRREAQALRAKQRICALAERNVTITSDAYSEARAAYPDYLDDATLLDQDSDTHWPRDLFDEEFAIPEVVVEYEDVYGEPQKVRMWSRHTVNIKSANLGYQNHKRRVAAQREKLRKEQFELEQMARREEEHREEERRMRAAQVVVSLAELKARRTTS